MREEILYLVNGNIIKNEDTTNNHLKAHVEAQRSFMNVRHPEFRQMRYALSLYRISDKT